VELNCTGNGSIKIFQVIPILTKEAAVKCYTKEVEYLDKQVGSFLKELDKRKLMKNTIVAIFADHGEGLGERDGYFGHVRFLNQQFIHVPLMIRLPGISPRHVSTPVSLIGLTPTTFDFMGISNHDIRQTENWKPLITKTRSKVNRAVVSFAFQPSSISDKLSIINWPFQVIFNPGSELTPAKEFYNLNISQSFSRFDRIDKEVMITSSNKHYRTLVKEIRNHKGIFSRNTPLVMVNASCIENLKMLGYIN
jgi:hypothetical protein